MSDSRRIAAVEDLLRECELIQRFVDRRVANGESGEAAFRHVQEELESICVMRWDLLHFNAKTCEVLPDATKLPDCPKA